jgi:hypothetical protein
MQVPFWMGYGDFTGFHRMLVVVMATGRTNIAPTICLKLFYEIARVLGHRNTRLSLASFECASFTTEPVGLTNRDSS